MWFKSFSVNQRQPGCLLRIAGRVDAIDPELSRERAVSRRTDGRTECANRTTVEGESLSALIAVIKFENLPDPSPTKILRLRISNRSGLLSVLPRAQADYFQALSGVRASHNHFSKNHTFSRETRGRLASFSSAPNRFSRIWLFIF